MNNNQMGFYALFLAVVCGATGCSSDATDQDSTTTMAHASASNVAGQSSTTTEEGGKTSTGTSSGGSSMAPIAGASGTPQTTTTVGGSNAVGGSTSDIGGNTSTGGTGLGYGNSTATGGNTSSTGGSTVTQCVAQGSPCSNVSNCCAVPGMALACNGTCGIQLVQATGGNTSTGGSNATGGKTSATGGATSTGGSSVVVSSGGSNATGGTTQTQCAAQGSPCNSVADCCLVTGELTCNGTCGIKSAQGTGGATSTGGSSSVGGSTASTGGNTGTGGSSVCVPATRPVNTTTTATTFSCDAPVRDMYFPAAPANLGGRIAALSANDIMAIVHTYGSQSALFRWNGGTWSQDQGLNLSSYEARVLLAVARLDANTSMIGGHAECAGCNQTPRIWLERNKSWSELSEGLPSWGEVVDLMYIEGKAYALVNYNQAAQLYVLTGTTRFSWTLVHESTWAIGRRIWATSLKDIFVAGTKIDTSMASIGMLISHFDGCSWNDIGMPSDVKALWGFHGAEGTVIALGSTGDSKPVRFISTDLVNWSRHNGDASIGGETVVWMASPQQVLIGAYVATDDSRFAYGQIVTGTSSWGNAFIDGSKTLGVDDLVRIPSTNTYFITSREKDLVDLTLRPRAYRVTCQ